MPEPITQRYFIEVSYTGTHYAGSQVQQNANSIQAELEKAFHILFKQGVQLTGSSRTDAGVHALQNFFHFDAEFALTKNHIYNLNALLPADIAVKNIYKVASNNHCRFDAVNRTYTYHIVQSKNPFMLHRAWYFPYPVNLQNLNTLSHELMQHTDFLSFSKKKTQVKTSVCNISKAKWQQQEDSLTFTIQANRFLRGMVRAVTATLLSIARKNGDVESLRKIIEGKDCRLANFSAPAHGLVLTEVIYKEGILNNKLC